MDGGNWKEMFNAACAGDLDLVRYHVSNGVDVNYAHPEFLSTPLVASILARQEEAARIPTPRQAAPGWSQRPCPACGASSMTSQRSNPRQPS